VARRRHHQPLFAHTYPRVILDELELFRQLFRVLTPDVEEPRLRRAHELDEDGPSLGRALGHGRSAISLASASDRRRRALCPRMKENKPIKIKTQTLDSYYIECKTL
jgi:hypothetical protein